MFFETTHTFFSLKAKCLHFWITIKKHKYVGILLKLTAGPSAKHCNEATNIFHHSHPPKRNLVRQSRRTKYSIQLIKEKNLLMAQINSTFLPDQQKALEKLLTYVKNKICSLRKSDKSRRQRWLVKKTRNEFKANPYNAVLVRLFLSQNVVLTSK